MGSAFPDGSVGWSGIQCTKNAAGLIPGQGKYLGCKLNPWSGHIRKATHQCFSLCLFLSILLPVSPSIESINISLDKGWDKKEGELEKHTTLIQSCYYVLSSSSGSGYSIHKLSPIMGRGSFPFLSSTRLTTPPRLILEFIIL